MLPCLGEFYCVQYLEEEQSSENNILCPIMLYWYIIKAEIVSEKGEMMVPNNREKQAIGKEEVAGLF